MWRDISATQVHQSLNPYQQYPPPPSATLNHGKWHSSGSGGLSGASAAAAAAAAARSSYSLPHPGHAQSNARWQKQSEPNGGGVHNLQLQQQLSSSARNLTHHQSFLHIGPGGAAASSGSGSQQDLSHTNGGQQRGAAAPGPRQRPASMYDTPSLGYGGMAAAPIVNGSTKKPNGTATGRSGTLRRNSAELVSFAMDFRANY